jgi:hypothetical protein
LLATVDGQTQEWQTSLQTIAYQWSQRDPAAAARWVLELESPGRAPATRTVAAMWVLQDAAAARAWVLTLAPGAERDAALAPIFAGAAASGAPPDRGLAAAFSNGAALERAVLQAVSQLAPNDSNRAHALAADYLTDPAQRARADQVIDNVQKGSVAVADRMRVQ